jgi:hypothetical protein
MPEWLHAAFVTASDLESEQGSLNVVLEQHGL